MDLSKVLTPIYKCNNFHQRIGLFGLSPQGRYVVAAAHDGNIYIWDVEKDFRTPKKFRGHQGSIKAIDISGTEDVIISGDSNGNLLKWDPESLQVLAKRKFTDKERKLPPGSHPRLIAAFLTHIGIGSSDDYVYVQHYPLGIIHEFYDYSNLVEIERPSGSSPTDFSMFKWMNSIRYLTDFTHGISTEPNVFNEFSNSMNLRCSAFYIDDTRLACIWQSENIVEFFNHKKNESDLRMFLTEADVPIRQTEYMHKTKAIHSYKYLAKEPGTLPALSDKPSLDQSQDQVPGFSLCSINLLQGTPYWVCGTSHGDLILIDLQEPVHLFNLPVFDEEIQFRHLDRKRRLFAAGTNSEFGIWSY